LIDSASYIVQLSTTVSIGIDGDLHACSACQAGIFRRKIEPVWAGINLKEAAVCFGVLDDALDVNLIPGALEKKAASGVTQDGELAIIHRAEDSLGLRCLVKAESGMNRAHCVVQLLQQFIRIVERSIGEYIHL
jgi:hypothetical protein